MKKIEGKNSKIEKIRIETEKLLQEPEFKEMSKAFKHTLLQRLDMKSFDEGGLVLQASTPFTLRDVLKQLNITGPRIDLTRVWKDLESQLDDPYSYGNIYSYSFW